jgi:hypothetical protein
MAVGTDSSYTVTTADLGMQITLVIKSSVEMGSVMSPATLAVVKKDGPVAPPAPTLVSKTHNSVTLTSTAGYEYSKDVLTWQVSNTFTDLSADTPYAFYQRVAETSDTYVSGSSSDLSVTTDPAPAAPSITTDSLPEGIVGSAYSETLTANGDATITWTIISGGLPTGLSLSSAGVISGTPATCGTFTFTVEAASDGGTDTKQMFITIMYPVLTGADSTVPKNTQNGLAIRVDADITKFDNEVKVDGDVIDPSNYDVSEGSTIITFTDTYLRSLAVGTHSVEIVFSDGVARTTLTVSAAFGEDGGLVMIIVAGGAFVVVALVAAATYPMRKQ